MLFREEYLEKVIRPKVMDAMKSDPRPKTIYDLCTLFGLLPNSVHTVSAWLRELEIPVGEVCELSLRARKMMEARGFADPKPSSPPHPIDILTETTTESSPPPKKKKKLKSISSKGKKVRKKLGKPGTKSKAHRHI